MKHIIKIIAIFIVIFSLIFLLIKFTGVLTLTQIEGWLIQAKALSPFYVGLIIALLLFADLFITVPTLTVISLSGYFLGHSYGALAAFIGIMSAGITGYVLSRYFGDAMLGIFVKNEMERNEVITSFQQHGFVMILLARALPMLPETTACLSGMTRMSFNKFLVAWMISSVPYILVASYAGSISSINDPTPAIFTAIGLSILLWGCWLFYYRKIKITK